MGVVIENAAGETVASGTLRVLTARLERYRPATLSVRVYAYGGARLSASWDDGTRCHVPWTDARVCLDWARTLPWPVEVYFPRGDPTCVH